MGIKDFDRALAILFGIFGAIGAVAGYLMRRVSRGVKK